MPTYVFHSLSFPNRDIEGTTAKFRDGQLVTADPDVAALIKRQSDVCLVDTIPDDEPEQEVIPEADAPVQDAKTKPAVRKPRKRKKTKAPKPSVTVKRGLRSQGDENTVRTEPEGITK